MDGLINRFRMFLGETRFYTFIALLLSTGFVSFALAFVDAEWVFSVQVIMALVFLLGSVWLFAGRVSREQQLRWLAILAPAFGLVVLGVMFLPDLQLLLMGAAFGWVLVGLFVFGRAQGPMQYRVAIKAMRKGDYEAAVQAMDELIKIEPKMPNHYRFRAELLRLWGKMGRSRRDYEKMLSLSDTEPALQAVAYNGLAEVDLQTGQYDRALTSAHKALELAPSEWVAAYNLGMIQDRLNDPSAVSALESALQAKVPDARHRLLIHLYRLRAYCRQGDLTSAQSALNDMQSEKAGLREWRTIMSSDQAQVLREVLSADIDMADDLLAGKLTISDIAEQMQ